MRANEHDLNSLRGIVRKLQEERDVECKNADL